MAKEKKEASDYIHNFLKLVLTACMAALAIVAVVALLIRPLTKLNARLDLGLSQQVLHGRKSNLDQTKQNISHEPRKIPPTDAEKESIKQEEEKYLEQKTVHNQRLEHYEETYSEQF